MNPKIEKFALWGGILGLLLEIFSFVVEVFQGDEVAITVLRLMGVLGVIIWAVWITLAVIKMQRQFAFKDFVFIVGREKIYYDSSKAISIFDFKTNSTGVWNSGAGGYVGKKAIGNLIVEDGIINLTRQNIDGRYQIWLEKYIYPEGVRKYLRKDLSVSGARKIRVMCEAKVARGNHKLEFVFISRETRKYTSRSKVVVDQSDWRQIDIVIELPLSEDYSFRITDYRVSEKGSVQIRNLILAEEVAG